ncbi:SiaB family protein kinase [Marinoscillum sp.]|uniref:SiaB family protein kinase n=1 Tax=Marinoscillum sp. TaxID=2024838 RepID=UPI003BABB2AC
MNLNLKSDQILFLHKGTITKELIELVVEALEQSVTNLEGDRKVRRKITNVFIEVFQNIGYHGVKDPEFSSSDMVIVLSLDKYYKIGTRNLIKKDTQDKISDKIKQINGMTPEELREEYKVALSSNELSEKGTAGLGFIDIARKSGEKLYCEFEKANDQYSFFYFETRIAKDQSSGEKAKHRAASVKN